MELTLCKEPKVMLRVCAQACMKDVQKLADQKEKYIFMLSCQ